MISTLETTPGNAAATRMQKRVEKRPQVSFDIHPDDLVEFGQTVPARERTRVLKLLAVLEDIHGRGNIREACQRHAAMLARTGAVRGWSWKTLWNLYFAYTGGWRQGGELRHAAGDWRMLARYRTQADCGISGRREFIAFWRQLCERHLRVISQAFKELRQIWETGFDFEGKRWKAIPGYAEWPEVFAGGELPEGWTESNLRRHVPDKYELTSARIGIQAASGLGLKVSTTRVGVRLFEFIECDDHEWNVKVNFPGQLKAMRPRGFGAADVLTSRCFQLIAKPTLWDATKEVKKALTEREFLWFVLSILTTTGYRIDARGTTFLIEHGTATVREAVAALITQLTGGHVKFQKSGRFHRPAHGGQFAAPSGGNFRFKAIIECYWRMIDDALDYMKGQTGKDRLHAPEEMERADADNARLLKASASLPPERAALIRFNRVNMAAFTRALFEAQQRIDSDPDHDIEGWEKLGFVAEEFRVALDAGWQPASALLKLPEAEQALVTAVVDRDDRLFQVRKLSRAEAFAQQLAAERGNLRKLPLEAVPQIVGVRGAVRGGQPVPVREGRLSFEDQLLDPDGLAFIALDGEGRPLREGSEFICFLNPLQPDALIVCDAQLRVLSVCPPVPRPPRNEPEAIQASLGLQQHWNKVKQADQRARWKEKGAELEFAKAHNAAVIENRAPMTPEEKQRARRTEREVREHGPEAAREILAGSTANAGPTAEADAQAAAREVLAGI